MSWRTKSKLEAEASAAQLRSILETVPDAMITICEHGSIELFSAAAERMFFYRAEEVVGRNVAMLMTEFDASAHDDYIARYRRTGQRRIIGASRRVIGKRKDGSIFPLEIFVGEAATAGMRVFTGFLRDLTAREESEARMLDLQADLMQISRVSAVGTMASALAHELNQPLTVVANYVQTSAALIAEGGEGTLGMVREALEEAGREVLRAGTIVNRLREFVAGGELDRTIVSPRELALQTCALGVVGGRLRGITCDVVIAPTIDAVLVDRVHIQQVLLNLIRNAMEAIGENGSIIIAARADTGMIRVTVEDTGSGIVAGEEEELFELFVSRKASGMGLGLAICRTIVEAHGGRLWCEAVPTGGAAFHFTLPVAEVDDD